MTTTEQLAKELTRITLKNHPYKIEEAERLSNLCIGLKQYELAKHVQKLLIEARIDALDEFFSRDGYIASTAGVANRFKELEFQLKQLTKDK